MRSVEDPSLADFTRTRWSIVQGVQGARDGDGDGADAALAELAARYQYPVYAYLRRLGHAQAVAEAITRTFLQQAGTDLRGGCEQPSGRFRVWLLRRLDGFLAGDWQDRADAAGGPAALPVADLEARCLNELATDDSPEQAYRRSFALEVLARGLQRLRAEALQAGHADMCDELEPFLARDPPPGRYDELGRRLAVHPLTLVVALKRLRQRFRELVRDELVDTVTTRDDLAAERQSLFAVLAGTAAR